MKSDRIATAANGLTVLRLSMTVVAGVMFFAGEMDGEATAICIAVALLDIVDGWMARRFDQITVLGAYLDPLVDKLMMTLVYLMIAIKMGNIVVWGLFVVLAVRDAAVTANRSISLLRTGRCTPASRVGKIKTGIQSTGGLIILGFLVWLSDGGGVEAAPVLFLFAVVTFLSYLSAWKYGVFSRNRRQQ